MEVGLGVLSFVPGVGTVFFIAGMGLSILTTAHSCATGAQGPCAFGIASILTGGVGYGIGRGAINLRKASDAAFAARGFFEPIIKSALLGAAGDLARGAELITNGTSLITSGLTNLPCSVFRTPGAATAC